jgi:4-amino-4-deoxy-L-arabinose transferase-like glycosyltransferase
VAGVLDRLEIAAAGLVSWAGAAAWRRTAILLLLSLALFLPGISTLPVTDRDEARFAQATKQMLETGDFIDIRFQDQPRWKKPVGIYWLQSIAIGASGGVETATIAEYRLPSLIGAALAAILTAWAFTPLIGGRAAFLAGVLTAATALTAAEANIAKTDAALLATVVLAMGAYIRRRAHPTTALSLLLWFALGLGVLIKGPIILLPVLGAMLWLAAGERSLAPLKAPGWRAGPILFAVMVLPWLILIGVQSGGGFFAEAVGTDLLGKLTEGQEKHWGPPGYYLGVVWAVFWPWAPLLLMSIPMAVRLRREPALRLLLGWTVPMWIVLEATPTKLPHYILPLFPALAAITALWLLDQGARPPGRWRAWIAAGLFALVGGALALANIAAPTAIEGAFVWQGVLLGALGLAAVWAGTAALRRSRKAAFTGAAFLAALTLIPATLHYTIPALASAFPSAKMHAATAPYRACSDAPIASISYREPSLVFLEGTDTRFVTETEAVELLAANAGAMVWVETRKRAEFDSAVAGTNLQTLAQVDAFNPNRGKPTTLTLFANATDSCLAALH